MKTKPKLIIAALCTAISFNANANVWSWFGNSAGDDGKANTVGNPSAKPQKTVFYITNRLVNNITSISVTDAKGKSIYNNSFSCESGKSCTLNLTNVGLNSNLTFKFMNSKNELVGAYLISRTSSVNSATLDESWLGIYLFSQLAKAFQKKPLELNSQLTQAFNGVQSPDNTLDIYEELGLYFIAQKGGANEYSFYSTLNQKLNKNQKLVTAPKKARSLQANGAYGKTTNLSASKAPSVGSSAPEQAICDPNVQSSLEYVQNLAGFIPVFGDAFAAAFGIGEQALSDACPKSMDEDIAKKFAEIDEHLVKIDMELNGLNYTVANIQKTIATTDANNVLSDMYDNESELKSLYIGKYTELTRSSNLDTYVKQNGNLKKAFAGANVRELLTNIPNQITKFNNLINDKKLQQMRVALDSVCNSTNISGDLMSTRTSCNMAISRVAFTYGLNAVKMKAMLNDEVAVIANAVKSGNVDTAWLKANISENLMVNNTSVAWDKAADSVNQVIDDKIKFMSDTLIGADGNKLYNPLGGLSPTLQQNIIAAKCSYQLNENSPVIAGIKEWHTIHENDASNITPYIVTECDDGAGTKITSKYYYNQRGTKNVDDKVINAMGVLVSDRFFHGGSQNNYGDGPAFPWANSSKITSNANPNNYYSDHTFKGTFNIPSNGTTGNAKSYVIGFEPAKINQSILNAGENNTSITAFKEESKDKFVTTYRFDTDKSELFTILRYTKGNYAYAWVMRTWGSYSKGGFSDYKYNLMGTPQCITNDCSINNTGNKLEQVKFIDGTTIDWTKNNSVDKDGYDPTVYPATTYSEYTIDVK